MRRKFENSAKALREYDADAPRRQALWDAIETNEDVFAAEAADKAALEKVQHAFYLDTSDTNSADHCKHIGIGFVRGLVSRDGVENA